jgi:hypothetical protein
VAAGRVNNGVDLDALDRAAGRPRDATLARAPGHSEPGPLLLAVGGIEERKNTVRVLQAFAAAAVRRGRRRGSWSSPAAPACWTTTTMPSDLRPHAAGLAACVQPGRTVMRDRPRGRRRHAGAVPHAPTRW